jgi:hypothetical protein
MSIMDWFNGGANGDLNNAIIAMRQAICNRFITVV